MKRRILSVAGMLLLLCALITNASAMENVDLDRRGSISITTTYEGGIVAGGSMTRYRVADVHVENGATHSFRFTKEYESCGLALEDLNNADLARLLAEFTTQQGFAGEKREINHEGQVQFADLEVGLYLMVQEDPAKDFKAINPFLVSVPGMEGSRYIYDVDASPKLGMEHEPTPPPPPDLPQTGLNKWPVPVLAIAGLLLAALGAVLCVSGKRNADEK